MNCLLVTGGCGFIGSNFVHYLLKNKLVDDIVVVDALTYAGNPKNLPISPKVTLIEKNICHRQDMEVLFRSYPFDGVINFAAETHVDRSAKVPLQFVNSNVVGTGVLLEAALAVWGDRRAIHRFLQISTDEVYGSLSNGDPLWSEGSPTNPSSPYSATKAAADHLVMAYNKTFGMNVVITRCSNNYGPRQHSEKLIPKSIYKVLLGKPVPLHGNGLHVRDWIHVDDHCDGIWKAFVSGLSGNIYNLSGQCELTTRNLVDKLFSVFAQEHEQKTNNLKHEVEYVDDRPGNDWRYAMDISKAKWELQWEPKIKFEDGLRETVRWYLHGTWD